MFHNTFMPPVWFRIIESPFTWVWLHSMSIDFSILHTTYFLPQQTWCIHKMTIIPYFSLTCITHCVTSYFLANICTLNKVVRQTGYVIIYISSYLYSSWGTFLDKATDRQRGNCVFFVSLRGFPERCVISISYTLFLSASLQRMKGSKKNPYLQGMDLYLWCTFDDKETCYNICVMHTVFFQLEEDSLHSYNWVNLSFALTLVVLCRTGLIFTKFKCE